MLMLSLSTTLPIIYSFLPAIIVPDCSLWHQNVFSDCCFCRGKRFPAPQNVSP